MKRLRVRAGTLALTMAMLLGLALGGCADDAPLPGVGTNGPGTGGPPIDGQPDKPTNGLVSIDEAAITGVVKSGKLIVSLPAKAQGKDADGTLTVSIQQVDAGPVSASAEVTYTIDAGATKTLEASLALPKSVERQPDLAAWVLLVTQDGAAPLRVTRSLLHVVPPWEIVLEGPKSLSPGKAASYRMLATDPVSRGPLAGVPVALEIRREGEAPMKLTGETGLTGDAIFEVSLAEPGSYDVEGRGETQGTAAVVADTIVVTETSRKLLLTTDKPIYQPGQVIHLRALALEKTGLGPAAGKAVTFEVEDGKGNKIHKEDVETDEWGIAATKVQLASLLNMGTFQIRAIMDDTTTQKAVEVSRYVLPKFEVSVSLDEAWYLPSATITGLVDASYFFGKDVSNADVKIVAQSLDVSWSTFEELTGKTNAEGTFAFSLKLPPSLVGLPLEGGGALVKLDIAVTDNAEQVVVRAVPVMVSAVALKVLVVPEAGVLVPGTENLLHVFVTDPLGKPVSGASVEASAGWLDSVTVATDAYGHAGVIATPPVDGVDDFNPIAMTVTAGDEKVSKSIQLNAQIGADHVLVRTDKAIYELGETLSVDVFATGTTLHAYVDWLNEGQVVEMRTVDLEGGRATFTMDLDNGLLGDNRIEAYVVDGDGNIVRASKTVFVRSTQDLTVDFETDKPLYEPGEPATLTFTVKDESGAPKVAALGVQIVDQAVFALIDAKPGLLETYFAIEDAVGKPQYEIHGASWNLPGLIFGGASSSDPEEADAAQTQASAAFAAMASPGVSGIRRASWAATIPEANQVLAPFYSDARDGLVAAYADVAKAASDDLRASGCTPEAYYCDAYQLSFDEALVAHIGKLSSAYDFWGNAYVSTYAWDWDSVMQLSTNGPDEKEGTGDEWTTSLTYAELGLEDVQQRKGGWGEPGGEGGWAAADAAAGGGDWGDNEGPEPPSEPTENEEGEAGPKVRDDFPETLYVNPALITGPDGKAEVSLEMADSITEWRVSTMAHSADGRLGSGAFGVTVFQDFFVDINFPATMTRGDEVSFPVAVYNFLEEPQSVTISLEAGDWYTALGETTATIDLSPGQVTVAKFPVRVETVGVHKLTVTGKGTKKSDAVARVVRVVPDGKAFVNAQSGAFGPGEASHTASYPEGAVPGSGLLYVTLYPAYLSQVVEGLDSMLQVPSGCFEQTTATTWPNVLVTAYMEETGQITPELQLKAESLIATGYQRLLTYEHPGGGFSWFGTQDPNPFLTVTALGVMEFADMASVYPIDQAMLARTQDWLAAQQESDGSWEGDISEFFSFQSGTLRNTAFVVWALASSGYTGPAVADGVTYITSALSGDQDPYTLATAANALVVAAPTASVTAEVLAKLESLKKTDGDKVYWDSDGTQTSFYGYGDSAAVETTAVATHALILAGGYKSTVDGAIAFLLSKKDANGNFGPTSSTVWTLRTLLQAARVGSEGATGVVTVSVDGEVETEVMLSAEKWDVMSTVDLYAHATTGEHTVTLAFAGTGKVSYNVVSGHHMPWAAVSGEPEGPLEVSIAYDKTKLAVNETVQATVTVKNLTEAIQSMVLVTVGIPPGFRVLDEDLQAYLDEGALSKFEKTGKQLTLYLFELAPLQDQAIAYRLQATMPVKAADGGATAYPYYEPEEKSVAESVTLEVTD